MNKMKFLIICLCFTLLCGCEVKVEDSTGWIVEAGAPSSLIEGSNGDFYLDSETFNLYQMNNDRWEELGNISGAPGKDGKDSKISVSDDGYLIVNGNKTDTKIVGSDGKDGEKGQDGKDGKDGSDGKSPKVTIDTSGYIYIDSVKLNLKQYGSTSCTLVEDNDEDTQADVGDLVTCGSESFYVIRNNGTTISLMAKWNLDVGYIYNGSTNEKNPIENPTGLQSELAKGVVDNGGLRYGVVPFAGELYWDNGIIKGNYGSAYPGYVYDSNSNIFNYLQEYKTKLEGMGAVIEEIRVPDLHEVRTLGCMRRYSSCEYFEYEWLVTSSYWTGSAEDFMNLWAVRVDKFFGFYDATDSGSYGIRPVIEVLDKNIVRTGE